MDNVTAAAEAPKTRSSPQRVAEVIIADHDAQQTEEQMLAHLEAEGICGECAGHYLSLLGSVQFRTVMEAELMPQAWELADQELPSSPQEWYDQRVYIEMLKILRARRDPKPVARLTITHEVPPLKERLLAGGLYFILVLFPLLLCLVLYLRGR